MFHQKNKLHAVQAKYSNSPQAPKRNLVIRYQFLVILFHLLRWCSNFHCWYFYFCYWSIIFTIWYRQAVLNLRLVILTIIQIIWYLAVTMNNIILLDYWASRVLSKSLVRYFFFRYLTIIFIQLWNILVKGVFSCPAHTFYITVVGSLNYLHSMLKVVLLAIKYWNQNLLLLKVPLTVNICLLYYSHYSSFYYLI